MQRHKAVMSDHGKCQTKTLKLRLCAVSGCSSPGSGSSHGGRSRLDLGIKGALHPDAPIDTPSNWALRVQGKAEQPLPNYQLYNAASDQPERKKDEGKLEKAAQVSGVAKHECRAVLLSVMSSALGV